MFPVSHNIIGASLSSPSGLKAGTERRPVVSARIRSTSLPQINPEGRAGFHWLAGTHGAFAHTPAARNPDADEALSIAGAAAAARPAGRPALKRQAPRPRVSPASPFSSTIPVVRRGEGGRAVLQPSFREGKAFSTVVSDWPRRAEPLARPTSSAIGRTVTRQRTLSGTKVPNGSR